MIFELIYNHFRYRKNIVSDLVSWILWHFSIVEYRSAVSIAQHYTVVLTYFSRT